MKVRKLSFLLSNVSTFELASQVRINERNAKEKLVFLLHSLGAAYLRRSHRYDFRSEKPNNSPKTTNFAPKSNFAHRAILHSSFNPMLTQQECDLVHAQMHGTMVEAMQLRFIPSDDQYACCEMPITDTVRQYFGVVHGGAFLSLAETLAGVGSLHVIQFDPSLHICGTEVSGTHLSMSATEGKVIGKARLLHAGRSTHVWNVDIFGEDGRLLSTERVTNRILPAK